MKRVNNQPEVKEFDEKVIQISRVSKKTKGGNKIGFSVLMVVGDKKGKVGVALGKAQDVVSAIRKGVKKAKKKMISVPLDGTTIPFAITAKKGAGRVMLKPAPKGSGVIAGGPVRAVVEAAGVRDISSKILGSENQASSVYATFEALRQIEHIVALKGITLKSIAQIEEEEAKKVEALQKKAQEKAQADESSKSKDSINRVSTKKKPVAKKVKTQNVASQHGDEKPKKVTKPKKKAATKKPAAKKTKSKDVKTQDLASLQKVKK